MAECPCGEVASVVIPGGFPDAGHVLCAPCALRDIGSWWTTAAVEKQPELRAAS